MFGSIKVCHFTSAHKWNDVRIFLKECSSLARCGFDVTLIAPNCESQKVNGINIIGIESTGEGRFFRMRKTSRKVFEKALSLNAEIYHFHDPELLPYGLKLKRLDKKVIYDAHEDLPRQILGKFWINRFLRRPIAIAVQWYENYVTSKLDGIITATPLICNRFKQINPVCTDINNFPLKEELFVEAKWPEKLNEVCYIGNISLIRGINQVMDAMEDVADAKINMAGSFSPSGLREEIIKKNSWDKVNEHGLVDRKKIAEIMARSKAGIVTFLPLPNHIDAQPNKMFEYMSAGIPVIASHFPLWKEIIEGNDCGICVDPENPVAIGNAIKTLTGNAEEAKRMGQNGHNAIINKYNWEVEEKKLIELYKNLCKEK